MNNAKPDFSLPLFVDIAGHSLRIEKNLAPDFADYGEYCHDGQKIVIGDKTMASERLALNTIRHEMLHAAMHLGGVSYNENHEEESIVRCIEGLFFPAWDQFIEEYEKLNTSKP